MFWVINDAIILVIQIGHSGNSFKIEFERGWSRKKRQMARYPAYPEVALRPWSTKGVLRHAAPESGGPMWLRDCRSRWLTCDGAGKSEL